jgi:hypothetical protein
VSSIIADSIHGVLIDFHPRRIAARGGCDLRRARPLEGHCTHHFWKDKQGL